jgi:hypothetical protein
MHSHSSSHHHSASTSSHSSRRPITPPPPDDPSTAVTPYRRHRNTSAPGSPNKARTLNAATLSSGSNLSNSSSRRRKHASVANMSNLDFDEEDSARYETITGTARERPRDTVRDITESALAAVASSRRSPLGTRRRAALPTEFRGETRMMNDNGGGQSRTDHRRRGSLDGGDNRRDRRVSCLYTMATVILIVLLSSFLWSR